MSLIGCKDLPNSCFVDRRTLFIQHTDHCHFYTLNPILRWSEDLDLCTHIVPVWDPEFPKQSDLGAIPGIIPAVVYAAMVHTHHCISVIHVMDLYSTLILDQSLICFTLFSTASDTTFPSM